MELLCFLIVDSFGRVLKEVGPLIVLYFSRCACALYIIMLFLLIGLKLEAIKACTYHI